MRHPLFLTLQAKLDAGDARREQGLLSDISLTPLRKKLAPPLYLNLAIFQSACSEAGISSIPTRGDFIACQSRPAPRPLVLSASSAKKYNVLAQSASLAQCDSQGSEDGSRLDRCIIPSSAASRLHAYSAEICRSSAMIDY